MIPAVAGRDRCRPQSMRVSGYFGVVAAPEVPEGFAVAVSPLAVPGAAVVPVVAPASAGGLTAPALSGLVAGAAAAPEFIEPLMSAPGIAPALAAALVLAPVEAMAEPDHQSVLARCFGVAAI
jgi:hypothetical protein